MVNSARRIAIRLSLLVPIALGACTVAPVVEPSADRHLSRLPVVPNPDLTDAHTAVRDRSPHDYLTEERFAAGYTIVVVGVNGDNSLSAGLAPGLIEGGYPGAVDVVDWTTGHWMLFVYHLRSSARHDAGARAIADKIAAYEARYPAGEVNLVGYSAGAAVVLEALEELPAGVEVDRVVLLAGAVSPLHDLQPALAHCRVGLWNYFQPQDVVALWAGTLVAGTADGSHLVSAGAVGFVPPADDSYSSKLVQMPYTPEMMRDGNLGGHFQCVGRSFVAAWIAPILNQQQFALAPPDTSIR